MGRAGYLYISGEPDKISMFKEFLKEKEISQKQVGEIYMDAVMFSLDKELYFKLKKKWLKLDEVIDYLEYKKIKE